MRAVPEATSSPGRGACLAWLLLAAALTACGGRSEPVDGSSGGGELPDLACAASAGGVRVTQPQAESSDNPLGIDVAQPRLSWRLESERRCVAQSGYEIRVGTTAGGSDVWRSGRVTGARQHADYAGPALASRSRYWWSVRVYDQAGGVTSWSEPAWFETAFLDPTEWQAEWIGASAGYMPFPGCQVLEAISRACDRPAPYMRLGFDVDGPVRRARLYGAGVGFAYYHVNGQVTSNAVLDPARTEWTDRVRYVTHDVTGLLRSGRNVLAVELGKGFYEGEARLRAELHLDYADGRQVVLRTGPGWKTVDGPTLYEHAFTGENYDAARAAELQGWMLPAYDDSAWKGARLIEGPGGDMSAQALEPIRVTEERAFTSVTQPQPGTWLLTTDQSVAGLVEMTLRGLPAGHEITLGYGDKLNPGTGLPELLPEILAPVGRILGSLQWDHYFAAGQPVETWEPRFSYKGFQYVSVQGWPDAAGPRPEDFRIKVMHTDFEPRSTWESSNPLLNRLWLSTRWAIRQNSMGLSTDTPVTEKSGWTGDAQIMSAVTSYMFDTRRYYPKIMEDILDSQAPDGSIPDQVPSTIVAPKPSTAWDNAMFELPRVMELWHDDERLQKQRYPQMKKYYEYFRNGWVNPRTHLSNSGDYGDWADPDPLGDCDTHLCNLLWVEDLSALPLELPLHSTAFWYRWNLLMAKAARLAGAPEDEALAYETEAQQVYAAFNQAHWDEASGSYREGGLSLNDIDDPMYNQIISLAYELVPQDRIQRVADHLAAQIEANGKRLNVGIIGGKFVLPVLSRYGHHELAYEVATQTAYPSWGYWVAQGTTSLWEFWEHGSRTHSHQMHGGFVQWYYETLAGMRPLAPGFAEIEFRPQPAGDLDWVRTSYDSARGTVATAWKKDGEDFELDVTVPPNATGLVYFPGTEPARIAEIGQGLHRPAETAKGVELLRVEGDRIVYRVGSGSYRFRSAEDVQTPSGDQSRFGGAISPWMLFGLALLLAGRYRFRPASS